MDYTNVIMTLEKGFGYKDEKGLSRRTSYECQVVIYPTKPEATIMFPWGTTGYVPAKVIQSKIGRGA